MLNDTWAAGNEKLGQRVLRRGDIFGEEKNAERLCSGEDFDTVGCSVQSQFPQ